MIPKHILDVLNTLSASQRQKFSELVMWAGGSDISGTTKLPINYDHILEMVKNMGEAPVQPVEAPKVVDYELLDRIKKLTGR